MKKFFLAALLAVVANSASAAIIGTVSRNADPAPGLESYTFGAMGDAGEIVNSFAGINVIGAVHNVQAFASPPSITAGDWNDVNAALGNPEWRVYDTHLLFDLTNNPAQIVGSLGNSPTESNDNSNPAGLSLTQGTFAATVGLGSYGGQTEADQFALTPAAASSHVNFLQVVVPSGSAPEVKVSVIAFDTTGARADLTIGIIPEPGTLSLAGLSLIGLVLRRRNG